MSENRRRRPPSSGTRVVSEQQKRIRDIKRRKEQRERRRKRIIKCVLAAAIVLIVLIVILAVRGCNNAANEAQNAEVTVSPLPTMSTNREIDSEFYADSCFIGNSFVADIEYEDLVPGADYICADGLDVSEVLTEKPEDGSVVYINALNSNTNYKKIFMMFGEEELEWDDSDEFISEYENVIEKAKKYQPDAQIYLISMIPVSEDAEEDVTYTNSDVEKMNKKIEALAKDTDVIYCDIFDALANSKGYLPASAAEDGIHLDRSYYEKSLVYIQKNYTKEAMEREANRSDEDEEEESSSSSSSNKSSSSSSSSSSSNKSSSSSSSSDSSNKSSSSSSDSDSSKKSSSSSDSNKSSNSSSSSGSSSSSSSDSSKSSSSSSNSGNSNKSSSSSSSSSSNSSSSSSSSSSNKSSSSSGSSTGKSGGTAVSGDLDDF